MAAEVLTAEPAELTVGTEISWTRGFAGWLPAEGTVSYAFQPRAGTLGGFLKTATDNGDGLFAVTLDPADTTLLVAGAWQWTAKIQAAGVDFFLDSRPITFNANPFEAAVDLRTSWEKIRDDIRTALESDSNAIVASYSVDNRSLAKASRAELFDALAYAEDMIELEANQRAADLGETLPSRTTIRMEFP